MLRMFVLLLGALLSAGGVVVLVVHGPRGAGLQALVLGLLLLVGTLFERLRYGESDTPPSGPDWERTDEVFVDPGSHRPMAVYQHRVSGRRRYVPIGRG
jgi:hypothetical protein